MNDIIEAFRELAKDEYFNGLSYDDQTLVLRLLSGGEAGKIKEIMDSIGYEHLFSFIYSKLIREAKY